MHPSREGPTISTFEQLTSAVTAANVDRPKVSVVIPCLNEEGNIERCVREAYAAMDAAGIEGEVVVADNASTDRSAALATAAGAKVVLETRRGYGSAYLAGFAAAEGDYIVMADADLTYDFAEIPRFVAELDGGAELVMGDRMDGIEPGAMPWLHQHVGNPLLSGILNLFFKTGVRDAHCGMRALRASVLDRLDLRTTGMEFASEMVIRAGKENLRIAEFPIAYRPRGGESKLSTFRDGWRHLRFLLVHSPLHLFMVPGALLATLGTLMAFFAGTGIDVFGREWQLHTLIAGSLAMIVGTQVLGLGLCAHAYGRWHLGERDAWFEGMRRRFQLNQVLLAGAGVVLAGLSAGGYVFARWVGNGYGELDEAKLMLVAATLVVIGTQVLFTAFLISILGLRRREDVA